MSKWTDEAVVILLTEVRKGTSDREIADILSQHFNCTFTRHMVRHKREYLASNGEKVRKEATSTDLYQILSKATKPVNIITIFADLGIDLTEFEKLVHELRAKGYNVHWVDNLVEIVRKVEGYQHISIPIETLSNGTWYTFGIVSDPHYGSKYHREDVMKVAYETFKKEGIKHIYMPGNFIDGHSRMINHFDLLPGLDGFTAQVEYLVENFPKVPGITTHFITSECHEGWWIRDFGVNIGEYIQLKAEDAGRKDLDWIGHMEVDIELKGKSASSVMRIVHPGGGSSYAVSYSTQKLVESYQGGEKPAILIVGHFHKALYQYERNVHILQAGCIQDQTPWMRKKRIAAHVGFWIVKFHQSKTGEINRFQSEFFPFFDRGFYTKYKTW